MDRRRFLSSSVAGTLALALANSRIGAAEPVTIPAEIEAITSNGAKTVLTRSALQNLKASLRGPLLLPADSGYDQARRVIQGSFDRRPALIVQPTGAADVRTAIDFARSHQLLLAVKCGGHAGFRSSCEGGMLLELSRLRGVRVDPERRVAHAGGGCLLGDIDHETMPHGLVTPSGVVSHTGAGGLTLGAGFGRLTRRLGLAIDNVRAVDVVSADGKFHHASADENQDLYWAVRGGGGNFGVVTAFEFQLHPAQRQVIAGRLVFPLDRAREVLAVYGDISTAAPHDLYADFAYGERCSVDICWSGAPNELEKVVAPLRKLSGTSPDTLKTIDYLAVQRERDRSDPLNQSEVRRDYRQETGFSTGFDAALVKALAAVFEPQPDRRLSFYIQHAGGVMAQIAPDATAFPHRRATHVISPSVSWQLPGDGAKHSNYLDNWWQTVKPRTDGYYTNLMDREPQAVEENYRGNLARLQRVKNRYDPTNLFRLNANVRPTV
jgi:FAD/FMN-containing dehydrogenase